MLKALILPLVVPSLITAVGSLDMSLSGKVVFHHMLAFFTANFDFAIIKSDYFDHLYP